MTITFDIPPEDEPRVTEAFGSILKLEGPATVDDMTGALITWMNNQTYDYERRKNMATFAPPDLVLNPPQELPPPDIELPP